MSPAEIMVYALQQAAPGLAYPLFANHLPKEPANAIACIEVRGELERRKMRTGERTERPGINIMVRGVDSTARDIMKQVSDATETIRNLTLPDGQNLRLITKYNTIGFYGQEPQTRRYVYNQQFRLIIGD